MVPFWQFGLVGIASVALVTDLQNRKIYNWLTFPAMLVGIALNVYFAGLAGLQSSLIGLLVGSVVFLVGFLVGAMGAGDVKLMAAVGAWLGWPYTIAAVIYVTIFGGLIAIIAAAASGALPQMLKNVGGFMMALITPGAKPAGAFTTSAAPPVAYGVSIALGTLLALFFPEPNDLINLIFHRG
jgi:prepilin peptidase CpaA